MALILVADDTPEIAEMLQEVLETKGHQVVVASDGVEMVEKAKTVKPALIIADIMMPGAYGSSAYKALQEDPHTEHIPVVFLTAVPPAQAEKVVPQSPKVKLLHKPVDMPAILGAVNDLLPPQ
jgi:CheY-like chemotaxis protein